MIWSRKGAFICLCIGVMGLALAGCGGGGSTSSTPTEGKEATTTEATSSSSEGGEGGSVVPPPPESPPDEIGITTPLESTPPKGKKVIFLQCEIPTCAFYKPGIEGATKALGWSLETMVFKSEEPSAGLQQAIAKRPDYIAMSGVPVAVLKPQLKEAEELGIPVISCAAPEKPAPGGYAAQCGGTLVREAQYTGAWMINDSGGKAHVLGVTIPIYPVLKSETDYFEGEFKELCPECVYEELDITTEALGAGKVPQEVAGYLQTHPGIEYTYNTFGYTPGMAAALDPAGFSDVKLTGGPAEQAAIKGIANGEQAAWTTNGNEYDGWVMVDAMARLANGEEITPEYEDQIYNDPTWVISSPEAAESLKGSEYVWAGPTGFEEAFEELWGLG